MKPISFLLVDDNSAALRELSDILRYLGHKDVQGAGSASEAWAMLRIKAFDCIISAWNMPEMSGLALLKVVRNDDKYINLPFFLTDSSFTKPKVIDSGRAGVTCLIVKPYRRETIKKKIAGMSETASVSVPAELQLSFAEGMNLLETEDYENALKVFEKLLEEGESAEVYYNIGYIKTAKGEYGEAIQAFRKATQLDSLFAKAYEGMGRAYKALGRTKEAEACLNQAAEIYLSSEKEEDAEGVLNEILEVNPDTINVYNTLGVLYRKKGEFQTALKQYEKALKIHPDEPNIHYNIGRLHADMKNLEAAKFHFKKALAYDSGFEEAKEILNAIELGTL